MKKLLFVLIGSVLFSVSSNAQKSKFLEGKKYTVQFYEMKATGRGKALPDFVTFKGGKIQSGLVEDKMELSAISYHVLVDSTFTEDDAESHLVTIEAETGDDKSSYKWEATITNYDIEGTVVQMKGKVEKKKYEFAGSEKTKK